MMWREIVTAVFGHTSRYWLRKPIKRTSVRCPSVSCSARLAFSTPRFVALIRDDCRRDATSPPEGETGSGRAGTWMVWLGVVALVMLGADEEPPR